MANSLVDQLTGLADLISDAHARNDIQATVEKARIKFNVARADGRQRTHAREAEIRAAWIIRVGRTIRDHLLSEIDARPAAGLKPPPSAAIAGVIATLHHALTGQILAVDNVARLLRKR